MGLDPNLRFRPLTAEFRQTTKGYYVVDHLTANCEVSATCVSSICLSAVSATVSGLMLKDLYTHEGKKIDFDAIDSCSININALDIDGGTDIGAALVDADLVIVDDGAGGTNRKSAVSRVRTYVLAGSGNLPTSKIDSGGDLTVGSFRVNNSLDVARNIGVSGDVEVSGGLTVSGNTVLSGTLLVSGGVALGQDPAISPDLIVNDPLNSIVRIDTYNHGGAGLNNDSIINFRENSVDRGTIKWDGGDNDFIWNSTAGDFRLNPNGNVGINEDTPTQKLDVGGGARVQGDLRVKDSLDVARNIGVSGEVEVSGNLNISGSVAIGPSGPASTAILDVASTTKSFLPPRMTTTQRNAISAPPAGSVIYNSTTNLLNHYNGSAWLAVGAVAAGASQTVEFVDALGGTQTVVILNGLITSWTS